MMADLPLLKYSDYNYMILFIVHLYSCGPTKHYCIQSHEYNQLVCFPYLDMLWR